MNATTTNVLFTLLPDGIRNERQPLQTLVDVGLVGMGNLPSDPTVAIAWKKTAN